MSSSYQHLDDIDLEELLKTHRKNLVHYQQQAANYGSMNVPLAVANGIDSELTAIETITKYCQIVLGRRLKRPL
jgi:hypothetical protein